MAQPAAANPSFHAVLRKQSRLCTAACACAPSTAWSNATRPISVTEYLSSVYPAARGRFRSPLTLFNSLHFYWDVAPWRSAACATAGAHLRYLWHDLTPCFQQMGSPNAPDDGGVRFKCAARQAAFSPSWALRAAQSNWLEIEHRAGGVVGRAVPSLAGKPAAADELSGMLDPGVAGMCGTSPIAAAVACGTAWGARRRRRARGRSWWPCSWKCMPRRRNSLRLGSEE